MWQYGLDHLQEHLALVHVNCHCSNNDETTLAIHLVTMFCWVPFLSYTIYICVYIYIYMYTYVYNIPINTYWQFFLLEKYVTDIRSPSICLTTFIARTSLVAQWLRICLPMQGTWVWSLDQEDPTGCGATKPVCHNYWSCTLQPMSHNYWAHVPLLLKPTSLEPVFRNKKKHCNENPVHCNEE